MSSTSRRLWFALALTLASLAHFLLFERFVPGHAVWLEPAALAQPQGWEIEAGGHGQVALSTQGARLTASQPGDTPTLKRRFLPEAGVEYVRVIGEMSFADVRAGPHPWHGARIVLVQQDGKGHCLWDLPHLAGIGSGSAAQLAIDRTFWISRKTAALELRVELRQATGELSVRDLRVAPVVEANGFGTIRHMLFFCWVLAWLWLVVPLMAVRRHRMRHVLAMLIAMLILAGSLTPHTARQSVKRILVEVERTLAVAGEPAAPQANGQPAMAAAARSEIIAGHWHVGQKGMHFVLFVALALAVIWARPREGLGELLTYLTLFAAICEVLQLFAVDRTPRVADGLLNLAGLALGGTVMALARRLTPADR